MATRKNGRSCPSDDTAAAPQAQPLNPAAAPPPIPAHIGAPHAAHSDVESLMSSMLGRDDGWMRLVPHILDGQLYLKWKYNRGPWTGYYAMVRVDLGELAWGLKLLAWKLDKIDVGHSRPVYDTPYND